jgi:hypothetical protein
MLLGNRYRNLPVRHKLLIIIMFTAGVALWLACGAILTYDQISKRAEMQRDLEVLSEIIGLNSTAALTFHDPRAAEEVLSALKAMPHIVSARIYTADGMPFASYHLSARASRPPEAFLPGAVVDPAVGGRSGASSFLSVATRGFRSHRSPG